MSTSFTNPLSIAFMNIVDMNFQVCFSKETALTLMTLERSFFAMNLLDMIYNALFVTTFMLAEITFESQSAYFTANDFIHIFITCTIFRVVFFLELFFINFIVKLVFRFWSIKVFSFFIFIRNFNCKTVGFYPWKSKSTEEIFTSTYKS